MTPIALMLLCAGTFAVAAVGTGLQRKYSLRSGLIDVPNERSSHSVPTPRSGGVAIFAAAVSGFIALRLLGSLDDALFRALVFGGAAIALVGYLDDRMSLSALLRLVVHLAAAAWVVYSIGGVPPLRLGAEVVDLGWAGQVFGVAAIVWVVNLFNFMDGIDGIAASEALFVCVGAACLLGTSGTLPSTPAALVFGAACAGFLLWNWPPAKIFMGDVGSGFVGFSIACLALGASRGEPAAGIVFLILGGAFFVDATSTLVRRMIRGEHFYQAHRIHAYQWLARRFGGHRPVLIGVIAINLLWLAPWGAAASRYPRYASGCLAAALLPLVVAALIAGAGKREKV